jgi:hypothetical protein
MPANVRNFVADIMRKILLIIGCFLAFSAHSQLVDSIRNSFHHKPKPLLALTTRNAFITNQLVKVRGVKAGVSFNNTTKVGLTYNWLRDDVASSFDTTKLVKMNYVAPFIEYVFYSDHRFSFTIPVRLGVGKSFYQYENKDRIAKNWILVYEPGMQGEMRFLRYFGVSAGIGFRAMLLNNKELQEKFNSPIYMLGFKIYFDTVKDDFIK